MRQFLWLTILFLLSYKIYALQLTGEAHAQTGDKARKQALAALSESLKIEVKSTFQSESRSDGYNAANKSLFFESTTTAGIT